LVTELVGLRRHLDDFLQDLGNQDRRALPVGGRYFAAEII